MGRAHPCLWARSFPLALPHSPPGAWSHPGLGPHSHSRMRAMSSTMRTETQKMSASRRWLMQGALNMEDPGRRAEAGSGGSCLLGAPRPCCPPVGCGRAGPCTPQPALCSPSSHSAPHTPHTPGNTSPWLSVHPCLPPSLPLLRGTGAMDHPILTCAVTGRAGARGGAALGAVGFEADAQDVLSRLRGSGTEDAADLGDMEQAGGHTAGRGSGLWAEGTVTSSVCCPPESPSCHPASWEGESNTETELSPPGTTTSLFLTEPRTSWRVSTPVPLSVPQSEPYPARDGQKPHCHRVCPLQAAELPKVITVSPAISRVFGIVTAKPWPSSTGPVPQFMHLSLISHLKNTVQFPAVI